MKHASNSRQTKYNRQRYRVQCCVCRRERTAEGWKEVAETEPAGAYSHGYCPACYAEALLQLEATVERSPWFFRVAAAAH